jgi:Tol biopolymer transport system component
MTRQLCYLFYLLLAVALAACAPPIPAVTFTPTCTPSATATLTITPTPNPTPTASLTPTATDTPGPTLTPTPTGWSVPQSAGYDWTPYEISPAVLNALGRMHLSFVHSNVSASLVGTPTVTEQPTTVYLVSPEGGAPFKVVDLPPSVEGNVYWSPDMTKLAYFLDSGEAPGVYVLDLEIGVSTRVIATSSLSQAGFMDAPQWSPDSTRLAMALAGGYDVDIYVVDADGLDFTNLTLHGAYDLWPRWSPDGRWLAFISDRERCPTWVPAAEGTCRTEASLGLESGQLHIVRAESPHQVRRLADEWGFGPPIWVTNTHIAFSTGNPALGDQRVSLWLTGVDGSGARELTPPRGVDTELNLNPSWAPDGSAVIFHQVTTANTSEGPVNTSDVVIVSSDGEELGRTDEFNFARFGFSADWSPDATSVTIGGRRGECVYGISILDDEASSLVRANPPPTSCDPTYSPDGIWIAFVGINPRIDGRLDLYMAYRSGYGARNVTGTLLGQVRILGWVGGG